MRYNIYSYFQKGRLSLNRKNFLAYILIAAVLLVPGFLSVMFYIFTDSSQISSGADAALEITDKNGEVYKFESKDSMSRLFYEIIEGERNEADPSVLLNFSQNETFVIKLKQKGKDSFYTFYFDKL